MMNTTKNFRIYGFAGHRMRLSFGESESFDWSKEGMSRVVSLICEDKTRTNDYVELQITRNTEAECFAELDGQLTDGFFEDSRYGKVVEIKEDGSEEVIYFG